MIIIRQKQFDEGEEGSSTMGKVLKGTAAIGGTVGAFYGARKGMFGNTIQMGANRLYGQAGVQMQRLGNSIGSSWQDGADFFAKRGNNMVNSAAKEWSLASGLKNNSFVKNAGNLTEEANATKLLDGMQSFKTDIYKNYGGGTSFKYDANSGISASTFRKHNK